MLQKETLKKLLFRAGDLFSLIPGLAAGIVSTAGLKVWIPYYHIATDQAVPHVRHLYPYKNLSQFKADLRYFKKQFNPIGLDRLLDYTHGAGSLPERALLLTFDDGMAEIYHQVFPILREMALPAVFFICSAFLDNREMFYMHKASLIVDTLLAGKQDAGLKKIARYFDGTQNPARILKGILDLDYLQRDHLDRIAGEIGIKFPDYLENMHPYLTSQQVEEMIAAGYWVGAHSIDHPDYTLLDPAEQVRQTRESVAAIAGKFALPYRAFSMPFHDIGAAGSYFDTLHREDIVDISFGSDGTLIDPVENNFQRLNMEGHPQTAGSRMLTYGLVYKIRKGFGQHIVREKSWQSA